MWALPRIEEVPVLNCPIHLPKEDEIEVARALSPTKSIPICSVSQTSEHLVLPGKPNLTKKQQKNNKNQKLTIFIMISSKN